MMEAFIEWCANPWAWLVAASVIAAGEVAFGTGHAIGAALAALAVAALTSASLQADHATSIALGLAPSAVYALWALSATAKRGLALMLAALALASAGLAFGAWRGLIEPQAWWIAAWGALSVPNAYVTSAMLKRKGATNPNVYDADAGVERGGTSE